MVNLRFKMVPFKNTTLPLSSAICSCRTKGHCLCIAIATPDLGLGELLRTHWLYRWVGKLGPSQCENEYPEIKECASPVSSSCVYKVTLNRGHCKTQFSGAGDGAWDLGDHHHEWRETCNEPIHKMISAEKTKNIHKNLKIKKIFKAQQENKTLKK